MCHREALCLCVCMCVREFVHVCAGIHEELESAPPLRTEVNYVSLPTCIGLC